MAEGDTILRLARRLERTLGGAEVRADAPGRRRPEGLPVSTLSGRRLERAESRGKHLLLHFDGGLVLHSHLGMKGSWRIYGPDQRWDRPPAGAWIALAGDSATAVNFGGSSLRIARAAALGRDPRLARLGPDILGPGFEPEAAVGRLRGGGMELGEALLDQSLAAGVGNIFKSEGCFEAGLDPFAPVGSLSDAELSAALAATRALMLEAAGSGRQPNRVYRGAGRPCPRCRTRLRAAAQGDSARTSYWCPRCQPARRAGAPAVAEAG
jgi:endonuclease-8